MKKALEKQEGTVNLPRDDSTSTTGGSVIIERQVSSESNGSSGGSWKAVSSLFAIISLLGGMLAIIRPITMQIDQQRADIVALNTRLDKHVSEGHADMKVLVSQVEARCIAVQVALDAHKGEFGHSGSMTKFAEFAAKFVEVETQFKYLTEMMASKDAEAIEHVMDDRSNVKEIGGKLSSLLERLTRLEEQIKFKTQEPSK